MFVFAPGLVMVAGVLNYLPLWAIPFLERGTFSLRGPGYSSCAWIGLLCFLLNFSTGYRSLKRWSREVSHFLTPVSNPDPIFPWEKDSITALWPLCPIDLLKGNANANVTNFYSVGSSLFCALWKSSPWGTCWLVKPWIMGCRTWVVGHCG